LQTRRISLWITEALMFHEFPIAGFRVTLYAAVIAISLFTFVGAWMDVASAQSAYVLGKQLGRVDEHALLRKFRSERNWWLALFSLTLWVIIFRVRKLQQKMVAMETVHSQVTLQAAPVPPVSGQAVASGATAGAAGSAALPSPAGHKALAQATGLGAQLPAPSAPPANVDSPQLPATSALGKKDL